MSRNSHRMISQSRLKGLICMFDVGYSRPERHLNEIDIIFTSQRNGRSWQFGGFEKYASE